MLLVTSLPIGPHRTGTCFPRKSSKGWNRIRLPSRSSSANPPSVVVTGHKLGKAKCLCLIKHCAMKTYGGEWRYSSAILDLGIRWRWSASRPCLFTPRKKPPRHPLDRRLGGPQSRSGHCGIDKISGPYREWNPDRPIHSLIAILTELSRLPHWTISWNTSTNLPPSQILVFLKSVDFPGLSNTTTLCGGGPVLCCQAGSSENVVLRHVGVKCI
jgi:hypothetical protein